MSWEEIDKLLVKMFDTQLKKLKRNQKLSERDSQKNETPSLEFKGWLTEFIQDSSDYEKFKQSRLVCKRCGEKIENTKFVVIFHPDHPDDYTKQLYFHSGEQCNPRTRYLNITRKMWLIRYQLESELRNP